jgi:hypothetical protein
VSSATVSAISTQPAALATTDETSYPRQAQNLGEFLFLMCESYVEVISAIRVYPFNEMCRGIMNNPVGKHVVGRSIMARYRHRPKQQIKIMITLCRDGWSPAVNAGEIR